MTKSDDQEEELGIMTPDILVTAGKERGFGDQGDVEELEEGELMESSVEPLSHTKPQSGNKKKKNKKEKKQKGVDKAPTAVSGGKNAKNTKMLESPDANEPLPAGEAALDTIEMKRLLRGVRYFTPDWENSEPRCHNCGEKGHMARHCSSSPRLRPCFVCGTMGHEGRECPKKSLCYVCQKSGHMAKDCTSKQKPNLDENGTPKKAPEVECLKCGTLGHEYFHCRQDYDPRDLDLVECFVCGSVGHLSCAEDSLEPPMAVTCFNCGGVGHSGEGCARPRRAPREGDERPTQSCFKCGEEGHFARGCSKVIETTAWRKSWPLKAAPYQNYRNDDRWEYESPQSYGKNLQRYSFGGSDSWRRFEDWEGEAEGLDARYFGHTRGTPSSHQNGRSRHGGHETHHNSSHSSHEKSKRKSSSKSHQYDGYQDNSQGNDRYVGSASKHSNRHGSKKNAHGGQGSGGGSKRKASEHDSLPHSGNKKHKRWY